MSNLNKFDDDTYTQDDLLDWHENYGENYIYQQSLKKLPEDQFDKTYEHTDDGFIYTIGEKDFVPVVIKKRPVPEIFGNPLDFKLQEAGEKVEQQIDATPGFLKDTVTSIPYGMAVGVDNAFKLVDSLTGGAVTELDNFFVKNFPNTLGKKIEMEEPEGAGGMTGKIIGQYVVPGIGIYKLARNIMLIAEPLTVGLFSSKDEGNLMSLFEGYASKEDANVIAKTIIQSLTADEDDSEFMGRLKNIGADAIPFVAVERVYKILKTLKKNPEALEEIKSLGAAATPKDAPTPVEVVDSSGQPIKQADQVVKSEKPFYSNVEKTISNFTFKKQPGNQILATLNNTAGIKQSEIQDLGLDTFLKDKPSVTKEELDNFIADKSLTTRVKDEILDTQGKDQLDFFIDDNAPEILKKAKSKEEAFEIFMNELDDPALLKEFEDYKQAEINAGNIVNNLEHVTNFLGDKFKMMDVKQDKIPTKYDEYVTPGGSNYKEMLITVPGTPRVFTKHHYTGEVKQGENLIAHARFNDRTIDGKKILFIEEIQSDLHQAGRKQGYSSLNLDVELENINSQLSLLSKTMDELKIGDDTAKIQDYMDQYNKLLEKRQSLVDESRNTIADAPFKNNWYELTMKRLIKYAIDNGYDGISFTTGKMQNERYNLAKKITALRAEKIIGGTKDGQYELTVTPIFGEQMSLVVKESDLERYVGKDLTTKIIKDAPTYKDGRNYTGLDLEFGGDGMKGFYDKMLPSFLTKYGNKYGADLQKTELNISNKTIYNMKDLQDFKYNNVYDAVGRDEKTFASYKIIQNMDAPPEQRVQVIQTKNGKSNIIHRTYDLREAKGILLEELEGFKVPQILDNREAPQVPIMLFTPNMQKEILTEGVPIAQVEERDKSTAVV
jgi:hypothetical protein